MTVVDVSPAAVVDVDLDATPACQALICDADNESPAVSTLINWCGCQVLLCDLCTRQHQHTLRCWNTPGEFMCRYCYDLAYGKPADLVRLVPL